MKKNRVIVRGADELDVLSAVWILSCNDENPLVTYEGIKYRLSLPDEYDIKTVIRSRGELFRPKVVPHRLEEWKKQMKDGKHLPSWISDIQDPTVRVAKIEGLSVDDVFRNQARTRSDSAPASIEVIKWGLEHIDRLRKAGVEDREQRLKRASGLWVPLLSMFVALIAVVSSAFLQNRSINTQIDLKRYETSFRPKQEGYALFMNSIVESFQNAYRGEGDAMVSNLAKAATGYYRLEPFFAESKRTAIWDQYQKFKALCYILTKEPVGSSGRSGFFDSLKVYEKYFHDHLYDALFGKEDRGV